MSNRHLILVSDDNESARYRKTHALRRGGFDVIEAGNGLETLRLVQERRPGLVVLDVRLPDIDGWEVCRRIKSEAETRSVLVLQVSATYVREEDTVRALEGGADGCLIEPIDAPVLIATVRALLRTRDAEDTARDALAREREARALAERANQSKDDFLATLSHELRSPMNAVLTWVTLLRTGATVDPRVSRAIDAIERNTRVQVKLIEDLLDISRITSGKMDLEIGPIDMESVIEAALDGVRAAAAAKGIALDTAVAPRLGVVMGDAARLQQVVTNLLSNAVKFTPAGGRVTLRVTGGDTEVQIRVADTGRGIEPEFLPHIFERFRQADSSRTRSEGGLGLGLAIVRHLVEQHGGAVDVTSAGAGQGTTFIVRLPAVPPDPTAPVPAPPPGDGEQRGRRSLAGYRVMVVEDEGDTREAITMLLADAGAEVAPVASVAAADALLAQRRPDVLISDLAMPERDGYALVAMLRAADAAAGMRTPALAVTAHAGADERQRALAAGYDAFLAKPVCADELLNCVASLAARARSPG